MRQDSGPIFCKGIVVQRFFWYMFGSSLPLDHMDHIYERFGVAKRFWYVRSFFGERFSLCEYICVNFIYITKARSEGAQRKYGEAQN